MADPHKVPNLGTINKIDLEMIANEPTAAYEQFLWDWIEAVKDVPSPMDLEYERKVGYDAGWNTGFGYSACYASLALALKRTFQSSVEEIESIFDRIGELEYEEISAADIIERAKVEAGVDVGDLAKGTSI